MATTAKVLIQAAFGSRTTNDAKSIALIPEMINALSRRLQELYAKAATKNPWYFSTYTVVVPDGTKWARPAGPTVFYAFGGGDAGTGVDAVLSGSGDPEDDRVNIVPMRDLSAELAPRIFLLGRDYYSAGGSGDPSPSVNGDKISFVRSRMHAALDPTDEWDSAANTLESAWPEHHNNLLVAYLERYLAKKDGRTADVEVLDEDIERLEALFLAELEDDNQGVATRWGVRAPHPAEG